LFSGDLVGVETGVKGNEVPHSEDTVHVSRVVSDISKHAEDRQQRRTRRRYHRKMQRHIASMP